MSFRYKCGYGDCKDNFTIEQAEVASFLSKDDAYNFIRMKYSDLLCGYRIYYVESNQGREYYNSQTNNFTNDIKDINVFGYEITAEFMYDFREDYHEEVEWETETSSCLTYLKADEIKQKYYNNGANTVDIESVELNVYEHFWCDKFMNKNKENELER